MLNYFKYVLIFFVCVSVFGILDVALVFAVEPQELKSSIDKKSRELREINNQILETRNQLETAKDQKQTLQGELKRINSNIRQLNLGIKMSQTSIEKLALEIEVTQFDIKDSETKIETKRQAIVEALQQLQQKNNSGNLLMIFLKNKNLADSVFEIQGLTDFQNQLTNDVQELKILKDELGAKLQISSVKKQTKEVENVNLKNKKIIVEETKKDRQQLFTETQNKEKIYQQSLSELQKKQDQIAEELDKLEEIFRLKIDKSLLPTPRPGVLGIPVTNAFITQKYGYTKFALSGAYKGKPHNGLDFGAPYGTPIYATEKGKVTAVANQDIYCPKGAYGKFITIEHENNLTTLYAHLSLWTIKEGDPIERGQLIGYVGNSGYSKGSHLHFGVYATQAFRVDSAHLNCGPKMPYGGSLNPADYLAL